MSIGEQIVAETTLLADAIRTAPHAIVRKYPNWDLAQLGRHVGEVHGWVTSLVRDGATERPTRAKLDGVDDDDVPGVLHIGAVALAEVLDGCDLDGPVWSFTGDATNAFWCRRMVNETTIHRWDAQDAIGKVTPIPHEVAMDGIAEAITSYLAPVFADAGWTARSEGPSIVVTGTAGQEARIQGGAVDLWLLTLGRRRLNAFEVDGDETLARSFTEHAQGLRGPAG